MPLYELTKEAINPVETIRFADAGLRERGDLQRVLREKIEVVCPDTLVVAEEFGQWEDSRRRIDLLGVDQNANLVVIELKRTEDGGHMDLQAVRYAAMISTLTFERVVEIFAEHLAHMGKPGDARSLLLDHLGWESPEDGEFAPGVRIVLASADFSKELTTSVLWLNEQGLDVRCVRMTPYRHKEALFVDVQQVVPLPEASEYTVQIRAKRQEAMNVRRIQQRDFTKFILTLGNTTMPEPLNKRRSMLEVVRHLVRQGVSPDSIVAALPSNERNRRFVTFPGKLDASAVASAFVALNEKGDAADYGRYFHETDELMHHEGSTYVLSKMWGATTQDCLEALSREFPEHGVKFEVCA